MATFATKRWVGALIVGSIASGVALYRLVIRNPPTPPGSGILISPPTHAIKAERSEELATRLADAAAERWSSTGVPSGDAQRLRDDLAGIVQSYLDSDLDRYQSLMIERGGRLNEKKAEKLVRTYMRKRYEPSEEGWDSRPIADLVEAAWAQPERRGAKWRALDLDRLDAGTGWVVGPQDTAKSLDIMLTMFDTPDQPALVQAAQSGAARSAWVQFPVAFEDGAASELRITFVLDERTQRWIPLRLLVLGGGAKPQMLF
jgi:hypothetical protein